MTLLAGLNIVVYSFENRCSLDRVTVLVLGVKYQLLSANQTAIARH
jgi:hypothetical protein